MGILIIGLLVIGIIILLFKKSKLSKKLKIIISIILITLGIGIVVLFKFGILFNILNKIEYEIYNGQETITLEQKQNAIAVIKYSNVISIDAGSSENYYIYKDENNNYFYYRTSSQITIAGRQEEKINKKGNINNRRDLEKIINNIEKKISSENSKSAYLIINYNGVEIGKQELLNKLFN